MKSGWIGGLLIVFVLAPFVTAGAQGNPSYTAGEIYDASMDLFRKGNFEAAALGFSRVLEIHPSSRLVPYARYMLGESCLRAGRVEEAYQHFEYYLGRYPEGSRSREAVRGLREARERLKGKVPPPLPELRIPMTLPPSPPLPPPEPQAPTGPLPLPELQAPATPPPSPPSPPAEPQAPTAPLPLPEPQAPATPPPSPPSPPAEPQAPTAPLPLPEPQAPATPPPSPEKPETEAPGTQAQAGASVGEASSPTASPRDGEKPDIPAKLSPDTASTDEKEKRPAPEATVAARQEEPAPAATEAVASRPREATKVRRRVAAQIFYLDGRTLSEAEKKIRDLKEAGIDTLIFRVFHNKGDRVHKLAAPNQIEEGVYFKTDHAPVIDDLLGKVVELAHRNGLEIFAWMTTRYANYGPRRDPAHECQRYNFETGKMEPGRGQTLFHPEVADRLRGLFRDLSRYSIDGILFQDDLTLRHNEDFSIEANRAFQSEFGYSPTPDLFYIDPYRTESGKFHVKGYSDQFWTWAHWKTRRLMALARDLMAAAREANPRLQFGLNLFYETAHNPANSVAWFSQSLPEALAAGFDYFAVMAYHRQAGRELQMEDGKAIDLMAGVARKAVEALGDPARVMMKIQVLDWKSYDLVPPGEVAALLDRILEAGPVSLAFVPYLEVFPIGQLKNRWAKQ
jgi:poly-beta-1,6-N-acetyl-D-glucosamine N-deacetylase